MAEFKKKVNLLILVLIFQLVKISTGQVNNVEYAQPLNVLRDHVTLSGFSSGGNMAQMLQIVYSSFFQGIGIFSHTFYRCGPPNGNVEDWDRGCTKLYNTTEENYYPIEQVHKDIENYEQKGLIEPTSNLRDKRVYNYVGLRSFLFSPVQSLRIGSVWERYVKNPFSIKTRVQDSVFVMPTDNSFGEECTKDSLPKHFIGNCGFSGAYEALQFLYHDEFTIAYPHKGMRGRMQPLRQFNQSVFTEGLKNHQMDSVGYFYVPSRCRNAAYPCLLHVFFHGCWNNKQLVGDSFILNSGYLEVAEANDIVMIFPQNHPENLKSGPARACWDTFGNGGELYATNKGDQVQAVWRIIRAFLPQQSQIQPPISGLIQPPQRFHY